MRCPALLAFAEGPKVDGDGDATNVDPDTDVQPRRGPRKVGFFGATEATN